MSDAIVVTGRGVICGAGNDVPTFLDAVRAGRTGIAPLTLEESFRFSRGAQVAGADFGNIPRSLVQLADPVALFALYAAAQAAEEAGNPDFTGPRNGVIVGTGVGGIMALDASYLSLYGKGNQRVHPLTIPRVMVSSAPSLISMHLGAQGPAYSVSSACSSANHAIGESVRMLRSGMLDRVITGGTEAPFAVGLLRAWEAMRVVSGDTCRPFCKDRGGLILGEGAGMLVLERKSDALARGATIHGEIAGYGATADAGHITKPAHGPIVAAVHACLDDAGLPPDAVGYINAHGTGTMLNDQTESDIINDVFGARARSIPVSSTKSVHGHALGASGAMEVIATLGGLTGGWVPATANVDELDPRVELNVVAEPGHKPLSDVALSNAFGFGGLNAVLALRAA